jgi:TonB family protein
MVARRPQPAVAPSNPPSVNSSTGAPGRPGAPAPSADPAPQGESESDPFASIGAAEFRPGKTNVRFGRKHRITRPRIDLAGIVDSLSLRDIDVTLQLRIDATGNVDRVRIVKSSGSASIDQACRLEAYHWWFEPRLDRSGRPFAHEEGLFAIGFR